MDLPALGLLSRVPPGVDRLVVLAAGRRATCPPALPVEVAAAIASLAGRRGWRGEEGQRAEQLVGERLVVELRGLGDPGEPASWNLPREVGRAAAEAAAQGARHLAVDLRAAVGDDAAGAVERSAREAALAVYRFDRFRTPLPTAPRLGKVTFLASGAGAAGWRRAVETGGRLAAATAWARDLANTPPNVATPEWTAARARALARETGARLLVLGPAEMARRGMGGILAVGSGSGRPPRLVRLAWGRRGPIVALVGKGVTFDTGGISIKPSAAMDEMKWDKCGAATALGILHAAAALDLPVRLRLYLPLAENMPDGNAFRPGDIVRCGGRTVEILDTDAEGRLLLADALAWAAAARPDWMIDFATLTGACVVALGRGAAGLFARHDDLAAALLAAAAEAGERLWRLPLWAEHVEEMRGAHADLRNVGERWAGASTAAAFLSRFVPEATRWAHLDIAGPAYVGGHDRARRGATGFGIATTVRWLAGLGAGGRRPRDR